MREAVYCAIERYYAMVGQLEGLPENVERRAARDREHFGETYLSRGKDGKHAWHPLPMIRFLSEVCGIPLREAREAVIEDGLGSGVSMGSAPWTAPEKEARTFFKTFGNVLEAREYAVFLTELFAEDDEAADYWRAVVDSIDTTAFVPEDTGAENWT